MGAKGFLEGDGVMEAILFHLMFFSFLVSGSVGGFGEGCD